jgi:hypothetical protein
MGAMRKLPVVPICRRAHLLIFRNNLDLDPKSEASSAPSRLDKGGVCAIVTTREAGCDGRDGDAHDLSCGRTADADGEIVWS